MGEESYYSDGVSTAWVAGRREEVPPMTAQQRNGFTEATAIAAEGARVGLVVCELCGAAILLDPRDDVDRVQAHRDWHVGRGRSPDVAGGLGDRLRALREAKGLSLSGLGDATGVSKAYLVRIETSRPKPTNPTLSLIERLAAVLSASPAWLAFGTDPMDTEV